MAGDMPVGATPLGFRDRGIEAREETCAVRGCRFDSGNARECGTGHGLSPFVRWPIQCREFPVRQKTPVFGAVFHLRPPCTFDTHLAYLDARSPALKPVAVGCSVSGALLLR